MVCPALDLTNPLFQRFCGADVGGFFGNPETELLVRWYQSAAYTPFFRGHAHIDTKRREPWLFGEAAMMQIRAAIRARYAIMPYLYTHFHYAHNAGQPIMRPLWMEFPQDETTYDMDDSFMLGDALLIKPVVTRNTNSVNVYLPSNADKTQVWYPFKGEHTAKGGGFFKNLWKRVQGGSAAQGLKQAGGTTVTSEASIDQGVPVFIRGGTIVPTRERARRSTASMANDPYTLHIAVDAQGGAAGELYMDDGDTDAHSQGQYNLFRAQLAAGKLLYRQKGTEKWTNAPSDTMLERIVVYGVTKAPQKIIVDQKGHNGAKIEFSHDKDAQVLVIRKPAVSMMQDWMISW